MCKHPYLKASIYIKPQLYQVTDLGTWIFTGNKSKQLIWSLQHKNLQNHKSSQYLNFEMVISGISIVLMIYTVLKGAGRGR